MMWRIFGVKIQVVNLSLRSRFVGSKDFSPDCFRSKEGTEVPTTNFAILICTARDRVNHPRAIELSATDVNWI